jgi:transcriptional antiterminator NusG
MKKWYVLQVIVGKERKIAENLESLKKYKNYEDIIGNIRVPEEEVEEKTSKGKKRKVKKNILPGYILIEVDFPENDIVKAKDIYRDIVTVNGVGTFVGGKTKKQGFEFPKPVPENELEELFVKMGDLKKASKIESVIMFDIGSEVRVTDGPFKDLKGKVENVDSERNKIRVRLEIFGMPTPVELDISQIERI